MLYFHFCRTYSESNIGDDTTDRIIRRKIDELKKRNSSDLALGRGILQFGNTYVLETSTPRKMRTVIQKKDIDWGGQSHPVYFVQKSLDYARGMQSLNIYTQIKNREWEDYNPIPQQEIDSFINSLTENSNQLSNNRIPPPSEMLSWHSEMQAMQSKIPQDIFESKDWVEFALSNSTAQGMKEEHIWLFRIALNKMISLSVEGKNILLEGNNYTLIELKHEAIVIVYSAIEGLSNKTLFLLHKGADITTIQKQNEWETEIASLLPQIKDRDYNHIDDLRRDAFRAYPSWIIKNNEKHELWKTIQKNSETGNLSLLQEQIEYLQEFKFPSYINGRAGSGKSTMLYYIFANSYYLKCAGEIKGDIVFISENKKLLEYSYKSVVELLQCNSDFDLLTQEHIENVGNHFKSFKEFLLELLPEEDKELFHPELYLVFSTFKKKYEKSYLQKKNKYPAEWVWFIITTYIYGYDINSSITSENYDEQMPRVGKDQISKAELKDFEKDVLPFYNRLIEKENYWDKVKIIKYLKENINIETDYEVILCDEAQDFSRVEIRFILSLSKYAQYDLQNVSQLPIVIAADPLQMINPTAFRADSIMPMFIEELKEYKFKIDKDEFSKYNPIYNYRSSQVIVNVANAVLNFRKIQLNENADLPQIAKIKEPVESFNVNYFIDFEKVRVDIEIQNKLKHKAILIPETDDKKEEYAGRFKYLESEYIKTAIEAKGIDYEQIILHGFGQFYIDNFGKYENTSLNNNQFSIKYFFNRLYVAITRGKSELIIIDSKDSIKGFWEPLLSDYANNQDWIDKADVSKNEIMQAIEFKGNNFNDIKQGTPEMAYQNALKDKERAEIDNNAGLMRLAANQFIKLKTEDARKEYHWCLGLMYEMEEKWTDAVKNYQNKLLGEVGLEKAANVYWKAEKFNELRHINGSLKTNEQQLRLIVANLMTDSTLSYSDIKYLYEKRADARKMLAEVNWRVKLIDKIIFFANNLSDTDSLKLLVETLEEIALQNDKELWQFIAKKYYEFKRYEESIKAFQRCDIDNIIFVKAQLEIARRKKDIADELSALYKIHTYESSQKEEVSQEIMRIFTDNKVKILNLNEEKRYGLLSVYFTLLQTKQPENTIIEVGQATEKVFSNKLELAGEYKNLLESSDLPSFVGNFVISRWIKYAFEINGNLDDLNKQYQEMANKQQLRFIAYGAEDIKFIPAEIQKFEKDLPQHFRNITIKNFRRLKETQIENLGMFNLILGDNNIGKTTLLEALLFTPDKKKYLERLAFAYVERGNIIPDRNDKSDDKGLYYNLRHDFYMDFQNTESDEGIGFIIEEGRNDWRYTIESTPKENPNNQLIRFEESDFSVIDNLPYLKAIQQPYMPFGKGFGKDLAAIYQSEIEENDLVDRFKADLDLFIPNIKSISANSQKGTIKIRDDKKLQDLSQFGEGANKLFRILILLALHKGKRIMIDEIDAGIHYSRFKKFWRIILTIAERDKTQIFTTTHNEECIEYFVEVLNELGEKHQKESRVVQMKMVKDIKIRAYEFESFNLAIEDGIEMRGGVGV